MSEEAGHSNGAVNEKTVVQHSHQHSEAPDGAPAKAREHGGNNGKKEKDAEKTSPQQSSDQPPGGYDDTPIPKAPPGWTIKITFHRATNLPMADVNSLSSDPYVLAQINTALPMRHKEDPLLRMRTPTVRRNTDPEWNWEWIVANVPSSGFKLKARVYDEDPADHDDRLGNVHVTVPSLDESWPGIRNQPYKIMKRSGSKRAYLIRACATCVNKTKHLNGDLYISIELLGRTESQNGGQLYTAGPSWWIRHYSPMLGRIANRKEPDASDSQTASDDPNKKKTERYNFQANQMQFAGPVPLELYHRYVEFKPFVRSMYTGKGIRGFLLSKALHHQHARVYNFDRSTSWGHFSQGPCDEMTRAFLDLVHYDQGGRIFTYVLTLDALMRFTETGKEFGVDMLSKHTMHSDVSVYIAFSGEFFVRRLKHPNRPPPPDPVESSEYVNSPSHDENETHPPSDIPNGPPDSEPPKSPSHYELVIDNDSGTYRPNAKMLPVLKAFLSKSLPGLHILTLDCQADAEKMAQMKQEQRDRKKKEGNNIILAQGSRSSSISSSDEEDLDAIEHRQTGEDRGTLGQIKHDARFRGKGKYEHWKTTVGQGARRQGPDEGDASAVDSGATPTS